MASQTELKDCQDEVRKLHARLDATLRSKGLSPSPVQGGISYKVGRASLCRIDFKHEFLRTNVGKDAEAAAPAELRSAGVQRGWLVVRPEHGDLAERYLAKIVDRALHKQGARSLTKLRRQAEAGPGEAS